MVRIITKTGITTPTDTFTPVDSIPEPEPICNAEGEIDAVIEKDKVQGVATKPVAIQMSWALPVFLLQQ